MAKIEGEFRANLNGWEKSFLEDAMQQKGFVGWLRNLPRRDWALCVPYELGGAKPFYPDFFIFPKKDKTFFLTVAILPRRAPYTLARAAFLSFVAWCLGTFQSFFHFFLEVR